MLILELAAIAYIWTVLDNWTRRRARHEGRIWTPPPEDYRSGKRGPGGWLTSQQAAPPSRCDSPNLPSQPGSFYVEIPIHEPLQVREYRHSGMKKPRLP